MPNLELLQDKPRSPRAQEFVAYVREEVDGFRSGAIPRLSTSEELRTRFGYSTTASYYPLLNRVGLLSERRMLLKETGGERLTPSREAAWMLGVLSGAGSVDVDKGRVAVHSQNEHLLEAFKAEGGNLFSADMKTTSYTHKYKQFKKVGFYDRRVSRMLGDLRRDAWTQTMVEKHKWMLEDEGFVWGFLEGFSELRGTVDKKEITFGTKYADVAEFLGKLLTKVGLQEPAILKKGAELRLVGIAIRDPRDRKRFSENVHLHDPNKDDSLEWYRSVDETTLLSVPSRPRNEQPRQPRPVSEKTPRSVRRNNLIAYVQDELARYRAGELATLSSSEELRARFGYSDSSQVNVSLRKAGLIQERKILQRETQTDELIVPSTEWAWMMGILASGGSIADNGRISFTNPDAELRKAIKSRGERLFGVSARIPPLYGSEKSPTITFNAVRYARALGNFTRDEWVETVQDRHDWLLRDNRYTWSFIEGVFETRGSIFRNFRKRFENILLKSTYRNSANFLAELMVRVGVEKPTIRTNKYAREGVDGVTIASLGDVRHFAQHVRSLVPDIEKRLAFYRDLTVEQPVITITPDDAIREWNRVVAILGHTPSRKEVARLKQLGLSVYEPGVYMRKFGEAVSQRNFGATKEALVKISEERTFEFDEEQIKQARAILEASKPQKEPYVQTKKVSDEEIINEWIRLTQLLGHTPTSFEIQHLRSSGKTTYSYKAYVNRFGDQGSFRCAVVALNEVAGLDFIPKPQPLRTIEDKPTSQTTQSFSGKSPSVVKPVSERTAPPTSIKTAESISKDDALSEWKRIVKQLGHIPSEKELKELRKSRETKYSPSVYAARFGMTKQGRNFSVAKRNLVALILADGENGEIEVPTLDGRGRPRKFSDEEVISEWAKLRQELGYVPNQHEVRRLYAEGRTSMSSIVYPYRFGGGSWVKAKEELDRILEERALSNNSDASTALPVESDMHSLF